jgi:hypothetical protein
MYTVQVNQAAGKPPPAVGSKVHYGRNVFQVEQVANLPQTQFREWKFDNYRLKVTMLSEIMLPLTPDILQSRDLFVSVTQ